MAENQHNRDASSQAGQTPRPHPSGQSRPSVNRQAQAGPRRAPQQGHQAQANPHRAPQQQQYQHYQGQQGGAFAQGGGARYGRDIVGKNGKSHKKKGGPWRVVFWIALIVLIGALIALGTIAFSYWQGQDKYNTIAAQAFEEPTDMEATALSDVVIDWDALLAINPDTVGWVYVPGTMVNYPIVHTNNNDKYLNTDFYGEQNWLASYGAIFLAAENTPDFSDANNIVYGHHMNDGSMFAQFADFRDEKTFNEHRTVYVFTPERNYKLTTFSLVVVDASDPLAQPSFADAEEMQSYIRDKIARSSVAPDPQTVTVEDIEKMFAFVTCADYAATNDRIVLFASVADSAVPANAANAQDEGETGDSINPEDAAAAEDAAGAIA